MKLSESDIDFVKLQRLTDHYLLLKNENDGLTDAIHKTSDQLQEEKKLLIFLHDEYVKNGDEKMFEKTRENKLAQLEIDRLTKKKELLNGKRRAQIDELSEFRELIERVRKALVKHNLYSDKIKSVLAL